MTPTERGISFDPGKGNQFFRVNMQPGGMEDGTLLRAGLQVTQGTKIGMKTWLMKDFGL